MSDDAELLRQYAESESEEAFGAFVRGRIGLVYSAAVRRTGGDTHLAHDVAQRVFLAAAQRAAALARHPHPTAWLYETTRFTASSLMRAEHRHRLRERIQSEEAQLTGDSEPPWESLAPFLDEAIDRLREGDRAAVLLRFFDELAFPEIARRLKLTDSGARLRVDRALEKLRRTLARRGITSTTAGLVVALEGQAIGAVPAGLASTLSASAVGTASATLTETGGTAVSKFLFIMSSTKTIITAVAIVAIGITLYEARETHRAEAALTRERDSMAKRTAAEGRQVKQLQARIAAMSSRGSIKARVSGVHFATRPDNYLPLMQDPEYRKREAIVLQGYLDGPYGALFKNLGLSPDQLAQFKSLLVEKQLAISEAVLVAQEQGIWPNTDLKAWKDVIRNAQDQEDNQIEATFGETVYNQYQQYETTLPERNIVNQLQQSLSYTQTPLTDAQANQMIQILKEPTPSVFMSLDENNGILTINHNATLPISDQIVGMAQAILSPGQMQAFQQIQLQQQARRQLGATGLPPP